MHKEIIVAGFGGQGVLFVGKLLCQTGMRMGLNVTYVPSYGSEVRGGTAHCYVVLSDEPIASPVVSSPDVLIVMNEPSLVRFQFVPVPDGLLALNSSLVNSRPARTDIEAVSIPATDMANNMGNLKVANMIMLGVCLAHRDILPKNNIIKNLVVMLSSGKEHLLDINTKAVEAGYNYTA